MKKLKETILGMAVLAASLVQAQENPKLSMKNMIKVGVNTGLAIPTENAIASVGLDVAYQNLVTPNFGLGVATGYSHFFGEENIGLNNNDFGVVPVAALFRYYPKNTGFYLGTNLGYGFIVGNERVADNALVEMPSGGLYIKPELGYHNKDWNFYLHYNKTFTSDKGEIGTQKYNAGSLGVGVAYNIALGK